MTKAIQSRAGAPRPAPVESGGMYVHGHETFRLPESLFHRLRAQFPAAVKDQLHFRDRRVGVGTDGHVENTAAPPLPAPLAADLDGLARWVNDTVARALPQDREHGRVELCAINIRSGASGASRSHPDQTLRLLITLDGRGTVFHTAGGGEASMVPGAALLMSGLNRAKAFEHLPPTYHRGPAPNEPMPELDRKRVFLCLEFRGTRVPSGDAYEP